MPVSGSNSSIDFDLVAEQGDAPGAVLVVGREDLDGVAAQAEGAALEMALIVALVLLRHQVGDQPVLVDALALLEGEGHRRIGLHRADAVDARHRGDHDHVVALQHRPRRRVAHAVDLLVDGGVLLDIGVGARDIGFGLVVVVVGDEILDRVVREEALELAVELGGQGLVVGEDQGRALGRLDDLGHGEGLAGAGDAEQHLGAVVALDALDQLGDRLGLVALGGEVGLDDEGLAALGLLRPRRTVRHPGLVAKLRPALAQQRFERLGGGGDARSRRPRPASAARAGSASARRKRLVIGATGRVAEGEAGESSSSVMPSALARSGSISPGPIGSDFPT